MVEVDVIQEVAAMASFMKYAGLALALTAAAVPAVTSDAVAADCREAAARVVAEVGGQLLSVRESGGECVIVVLVPGSGSERPRKVTMRVAQ